MRADDHDIFRDELAERRRERDREHEPRKFRRPTPDHRSRQAAAARRLDVLNAAADDSLTAIECPLCLGPVFAPVNSHGEQVDCYHCDARLVTHRAIGGELTALLVKDGAP